MLKWPLASLPLTGSHKTAHYLPHYCSLLAHLRPLLSKAISTVHIGGPGHSYRLVDRAHSGTQFISTGILILLSLQYFHGHVVMMIKISGVRSDPTNTVPGPIDCGAVAACNLSRRGVPTLRNFDTLMLLLSIGPGKLLRTSAVLRAHRFMVTSHLPKARCPFSARSVMQDHSGLTLLDCADFSGSDHSAQL